MLNKQSLKPGEKILFGVFGAFMVLAIIGYIALETVRHRMTEPMFASLSSFDFGPDGKRGSVLFRTSGCDSCHSALRNGTNNGLILDGLGSRKTLAWIQEFLIHPEETYGAETFDHGFPGSKKEASYVASMPHKDLESIAVFLSELKAEPGSALSTLPPPESSGFIDRMVKIWAPSEWKGKYEDIRVKMKREAGEAEHKVKANE